MLCIDVVRLRAAYIARELSDDQVQEILTHLDVCQSCHEAYLKAIALEVDEILTRGPALTRHLTTEEIDDERIMQTRRSARGDAHHSWPMEDFNYRRFLPAADPDGGPGWWVSLRSRPLERAAWEVTLVLPEGPETRALLLLLSLGGLYDWETVPMLQCPVRFEKPPDWFLRIRPRQPLAPIWAVVSVAALLARLREIHGKRRLRSAARRAEKEWGASRRARLADPAGG